MAYELVDKYKSLISIDVRKEAWALLKSKKIKIGKVSDDEYENSKLHFIEASIKLLKKSPLLEEI